MAESLERQDVDEDALVALAERISAVLVPGDVVVLRGEVGAGKTTFVRAAARSLGVRERVTSPTYQFARGYEGRSGDRTLRVNHLDLYRLEGVEEQDALELDEYLDSDSVTFVEWAEPALGLLEEPPTLVEIAHVTPTTRRVRVSGPAAARLLGSL
ncbi:MAG: tRNA (adenosine(37)-N6)-threonylcarbamoyltransferase complex ATPase subunit type 1 TsaE [Actinobacteria bacterium]|jgi:tRNA threonylcarbamoyladenosine biosynthesis protein TsaE|nr:tRNA (adenosine(37)-N6)-threonylcarbamoyltransferase complex ATPase subunit type 1 TsaE [Actinomycetota bacterium]PLS86639.1 MAG: tRNA (adenosine(37)-N6)-threonylcarbamoyltransferase complex ATPase subunit type 1 TsaE [Actinomycetota bacterium]